MHTQPLDSRICEILKIHEELKKKDARHRFPIRIHVDVYVLCEESKVKGGCAAFRKYADPILIHVRRV
jgi:hypothetical protein